jgi:hypothetical protein
MGRRKAIQAATAQMNTKTLSLSLKSLSGWVDLGTWRGFDLWNCVLEWMLFLLYWMGTSKNLDANEWGGWGVFIASNHFLAVGWVCWRWAHRTCTVHCPVRATSARPLGFWSGQLLEPLSYSCIGQSGATPDMSSDLWLLPRTVHFCSQPLTRSDYCFIGSPDMSGAHRTVRWIIAECAQRISESGLFVRCLARYIGHCPVRQTQHTLKSFAPNLFVSPTEILSWFVLNLMHLR